jgi:SapC
MIKHIALSLWPAPLIPIEPPFAELDTISWLPLADGELLLGAHYYPLAVRLDGASASIGAITRRDMMVRSLMGANGKWSGAYTPISMRCFPLRLSGAPTGNPLVDLEVAILPRKEVKPRLLKLKDEAGEATEELKSIHEGLTSVWDGQQHLQAAIDLLLVADLLVPIADPDESDRQTIYHTIDRRKFAQFSKFGLEAMTRANFSAVEVATALTFSQAHLRADLRPPAVPASPAAESAVGGADSALAAGIDTITPWLDTSELFPGAWAADPSMWSPVSETGAEPAVSAPASTSKGG